MKFHYVWLMLATLHYVTCSPVANSTLLAEDADKHVGHVKSPGCTEAVHSIEFGGNSSSNISEQYIECVSPGWGIIKTCEAGFQFNASSGQCLAQQVDGLLATESESTTWKEATEEPSSSTPSDRNSRFVHTISFFNVNPIVSTPVVVPWLAARVGVRVPSIKRIRLESSSSVSGNVSCNGSNACVNGICNEWSVKSSKCICLIGFDGEFCENQPAKSPTLFSEILNGSFSLNNYLHDEFANATQEDAKRSAQVKPNIIESAANVSYDEFVVRLVDQLWMDINREGSFLYMYNFEQVFNESNVPEMLKRICFYARHVQFNIDTYIGSMEQALSELASQLGNTSIRLNAIQNLEIGMGSNDSIEVNAHDLNRTGVIAAIKTDLNRTSCRAKKLYNYYVSPNVVNGSEIVYTEAQVASFLDKMHNATVSNWNMVVEYGFKYFTHKISGNKVVVKKRQVDGEFQLGSIFLSSVNRFLQ